VHSSPRRPPQFNRRLTTLTVFGPKTRLIRHYDSRKFTMHCPSTLYESTWTGELWAC